MFFKGEKKSGYTVPEIVTYGGLKWELATSATGGYPRKSMTRTRVAEIRKDGLRWRVRQFSRKVNGRPVVRYHIYVTW